MITLEGVSKSYGETVAVDNLSMELPTGKIVILAGPSGSGKTTILKMINRLIEPDSGRILIDGVDTQSHSADSLRRSIGYVIQQVGLFPHVTIADNVGTVPRLLGWDKKRRQARVEELLDLVGLPAKEYAQRRPSQLSGGQAQRVGVARALAADPPVLLMDEPFAALDPITRLRLQDELLRLQTIVQKTIVFVTHDINEAIKLGDLIALFQQGGRLAQYATPADLLAHPASPFVEEFLGRGSMVRRLELIPLRSLKLPMAGPKRPSTQVSIDGTLLDALNAVLASKEGCVAVVDQGSVAGELNADAIRRALPMTGAWSSLKRVRLPLTPIFVVAGLVAVALYVSHQPARLGDDQIINRSSLRTASSSTCASSSYSFAFAAVIGVPLGIFVGQAPRIWSGPVFLVANLGQAIPGVALLALAFTYFGLGLKPTVIALVLYALLPILRNTSVGIRRRRLQRHRGRARHGHDAPADPDACSAPAGDARYLRRPAHGTRPDDRHGHAGELHRRRRPRRRDQRWHRRRPRPNRPHGRCHGRGSGADGRLASCNLATNREPTRLAWPEQEALSHPAEPRLETECDESSI